MMNFWHGIGHAVATGFVVALTALNGTVAHPVIVPAHPQAIPAQANSSTPNAAPIPAPIPNPEPPDSSSSTIPVPASSTSQNTSTPLQPIAPVVIVPPPAPKPFSSSTPKSAILLRLGTSTPEPKPILTIIPPTPASTPVPSPKPITTTKNIVVPISTSTITAQGLLNNTTTTFKQVYGGAYEAAFITMANGQSVPWLLDSTSFGGVSGIPLMTADISCNPPPNTDVTSPDNQLRFAISTTYTCTISLTPLTGSDRRIQTKTLTFTTPSGQLTIYRAPSMNSLLANDENDGGIVFSNTDPNPITITGLTLDVSYRYLTTATRPLILRLLAPDTGIQLSDYHLESLPADASLPYANSNPSLNASVVFTVPGASQKMLPLEIFGVSKMLMTNTSPNVAISVRSVTTNRNGLKIIYNNPTITWTCNVTLGNYDPNGTSTAEACRG